jgi:GR25 family glycosyltransferase involved in LPS biosynthesis
MIAHIIINKARLDRLAHIKQQVAEQGITAQYHDAVIDTDNPVRGCHLSHRKIVQFAKDNDFPSVWIMEDDCVFTVPDAAREFINSMPACFKVYTAGMYGVHKYSSAGGAKFLYPTSMSGTHCYVINRTFYDAFLSMNENEHLDITISKAMKAYDIENTNIVIRNEIYALQLPGYSDITKQIVDYNNSDFVKHSLYGTTLEKFNERLKAKIASAPTLDEGIEGEML